ncbi:MAG: MBL fold metallo-hydrolase [Candidatus Methanogasteraceae archaeon]
MAIRKIKLIKIGTLAFESFEIPDPSVRAMKYFCGIGAGSNVVYIETDDRKILVDTGFDYEENSAEENRKRNRRRLINALEDYGLRLEDIDSVFITHWHGDHFGNLDLFDCAEILALRSHKGLAFECQEIGDLEDITEGVMVMATPGHTRDHASLVLSPDEITQQMRGVFGEWAVRIEDPCIVIAGDAIVSQSYYLEGKFWDYNADFFSIEQSRISQQAITEIADYIIPGHGTVFQNIRKPVP